MAHVLPVIMAADGALEYRTVDQVGVRHVGADQRGALFRQREQVAAMAVIFGRRRTAKRMPHQRRHDVLMQRHLRFGNAARPSRRAHDQRRLRLPAAEVAAMAPVAEAVLVELLRMVAKDQHPVQRPDN